MILTPLDWVIVVASLAISFAPALWLARRAGANTSEFFTSGRAAPWWLPTTRSHSSSSSTTRATRSW